MPTHNQKMEWDVVVHKIEETEPGKSYQICWKRGNHRHNESAGQRSTGKICPMGYMFQCDGTLQGKGGFKFKKKTMEFVVKQDDRKVGSGDLDLARCLPFMSKQDRVVPCGKLLLYVTVTARPNGEPMAAVPRGAPGHNDDTDYESDTATGTTATASARKPLPGKKIPDVELRELKDQNNQLKDELQVSEREAQRIAEELQEMNTKCTEKDTLLQVLQEQVEQATKVATNVAGVLGDNSGEGGDLVATLTRISEEASKKATVVSSDVSHTLEETTQELEKTKLRLEEVQRKEAELTEQLEALQNRESTGETDTDYAAMLEELRHSIARQDQLMQEVAERNQREAVEVNSALDIASPDSMGEEVRRQHQIEFQDQLERVEQLTARVEAHIKNSALPTFSNTEREIQDTVASDPISTTTITYPHTVRTSEVQIIGNALAKLAPQQLRAELETHSANLKHSSDSTTPLADDRAVHFVQQLHRAINLYAQQKDAQGEQLLTDMAGKQAQHQATNSDWLVDIGKVIACIIQNEQGDAEIDTAWERFYSVALKVMVPAMQRIIIQKQGDHIRSLTVQSKRERDLAETGSDDDNAQEELQQRVVDLEDALTKKQEEFEQSQNTLSAMDAKIKTAEEKIAALQDSLLFAETQLREAKAEAATLSHSNSAAFQISVTAPSNDARSSSSDDSDKGYRTKELTDQLRDLEMDNKMLKNRLKEAQEAALSLQPNERKVRFPNDSDSSSSSSSGGERTSKSTLRRRIATLQRDLTTLQQQQQQQQGKQAHAADHSDNEHDALQGRIDELRNQLTQVEDQKLVQHQQQQQLQDRNASLEQRIHDLESQIHESSTSSTPPSSPPPPLVPQTEPPPTSPPSTHTARVIPATIIPSSPQQEEPEDEKEPQSQEPEQHEPHRPQQVDLTDSSSSSSDSSSDAEPESNTPAHIPPTSDNLSERSISIGSGDDEPAAQQRDNKLSPEHDIMAEDDNEPESAQTEEEDPEQARADQRARETNQYACEEWLLEQYIDELAAGNSCRISTVVLSRLTLEWECFSPKYLDPDCGNTWIRNIPIVLYNEAVKVKADDSETACQWLSVVIGLGTSYHRAFPTLDIQKKYLMPSWTATGLPGSPLTSKTNVLELTRPPATPCVDGLHAATNPQDRGLNGAVCIIEWFCRALQPTISVLYSKLMTPTLQHIDMYFNVVIVMPVIMAIQTKKPNPDVQVGEISSCCKKLSHLLRKYKVPDVLNRLVVSHLYKHIDIHFFNSVLNNHVEFSTMDSGFLLNMAVRQVDDEMRKYWPHIHPHPELVCSLAAGQTLMVPKEQWVGELSKLPDVQALLKHINSHQMHSLLSTYRAGRFEKAGIPEEFMKRLKVDMNAHPKERGTQQPEEHPAWDYDNVRAIEWPTPDEIDMQEQVTMDQQGFSDFINEILVDLPAPAALVEKSSTYQQLSVLFDTGIE